MNLHPLRLAVPPSPPGAAPGGAAHARALAARIARNGPLAPRNINASVPAADPVPAADAPQRAPELGMAAMASRDPPADPRAFERRV